MNTNNIEVNTQNSIKITGDKTIYFDPFKIENKMNDADILFITHDHYDHFDIDSINNIKNDNTLVVAPKSMESEIRSVNFKDYVLLNPNEEVNIEDINIKTIPSYNIDKQFHPRNKNYLGYVVTINNITYFVAGDTDNTIEASNVKCDIAFVSIGGHYTMDVREASELIKSIKPKIVIPTHYGSIVGSLSDAEVFKDYLSDTDIIVTTKL